MKNRFIVKDIGEEGAMVYDQKRDEVHFLNPTAYLIWTLFKENKLLKEIERTLRERYHSKNQRDISSDVEICLRELREKELLSLSPQKKTRNHKKKERKKRLAKVTR